MRYHVAASFGPNEEFQVPDGGWFSIFRAIAYDSWLIWRDALPEDPTLWRLLDQDQFQAIAALGKRIHSLHQLLPDYRRLSDSPFKVSRWWDPLDIEEDWHAGGRCLLRVAGYDANQLPLDAAPKLGLVARPVSQSWCEFSLPPDPPAPAPRPRNDEHPGFHCPPP